MSEKLLNQIKEKLISNNATISKADKGNSIVILPKDVYRHKIQNFINDNTFIITDKGYTNSYQEDIRHTNNTCPNLIQKDKNWQIISLNTSPPAIRGLIKIHKENSPIRPIINWRGAPAYKMPKRNSLKTSMNLFPCLTHTM